MHAPLLAATKMLTLPWYWSSWSKTSSLWYIQAENSLLYRMSLKQCMWDNHSKWDCCHWEWSIHENTSPFWYYELLVQIPTWVFNSLTPISWLQNISDLGMFSIGNQQWCILMFFKINITHFSLHSHIFIYKVQDHSNLSSNVPLTATLQQSKSSL